MDIHTLTQQLTAFLVPFLPYLLKAGEKAAEEAGGTFGAAAWEKAKALWNHLRPKEQVQAAAEAAAALPDNPAIHQGLVDEITRALQDDPALTQTVAEAINDEVVQQVIATQGSRVEAVEQEAGGGPTTQEVRADAQSVITGIKQIASRRTRWTTHDRSTSRFKPSATPSSTMFIRW